MKLPGLLGLDVETTYLTDRGHWDPDFAVRTVQFSDGTETVVLDLHDEEQRLRAVGILSDERNTFCSHTDMDVLSVWVEFGIDITERNVDTRMLAIQADPDNRADRDLKTLATQHGMPELAQADADLYEWMKDRWVVHGGRRNGKRADVEEQGWNALAAMPAGEWPEVFTLYAGLDALAVRRLAEILTPLTRAPEEVLRADQWLHVRAARLRLAGKRVDREALEQLAEESSQITGDAKGKAMELTGGVNIGGPKIHDWLAGHGVDWQRWHDAEHPLTDTGKPSLAKEHVRLLYDFDLDDTARAVVDEMVRFKGHQDLWNKTRDLAKRVHTDHLGGWRIHPLLNPIGATTTARMSSSGPNMQNFSKRDPRMRGLILPEPEHVLVTIDFAQVELRVVAALAREEKMIETIRAGGDLHQLTVDELASVGVTITRDQAKIVNFLIVYGGGAKALYAQTGIPLEEARGIIAAWRERYRSISVLAQYLGMETEELRTVSNRRLPVTRVKGSGERAGEIRSYANINYMVQSAARELLVGAWMDLEVKHNRPGVVWWPVHDELVLQVRDDPDEIEAVIADAEESMTFDFRGVPIEADAVVLRDEHGVSRWMTGKHSEAITEMAASGA